jgi:Phage terminase large subunit gpA, ATPase domain/Terminase large subunit gpA, endonuclease domain
VTASAQVICAAANPPSDLPIDLWIEQNVYLAGDSDLKGPVNFEFLPMVRFFLRSCQDPAVRVCDLMCSAQSAKTKSVEFYLTHKLLNNPGTTIWYTDTNESAKQFSQTRLYDDLHGCDLVREKLPADRHRQKWSLIQFDDMDLYVLGANTKRNRERVSAEEVLCDERRNFPPGAMPAIRNRYKTFRRSKQISFSSAGDEFDEWHQGWLDGTQHFFHWACLKCGHRQPFRFGRHATSLFPAARECGGLIWEDSAATHPSENVWVTQEVRKTVRYQCENPACRREYRNAEKPALLATMNESNHWGAVQTNPMASPAHVSMHWNELYMPWADAAWEMVVEKFLKAHVNLKRTHNEEPLKVFVQETLGEPWRIDTQKVEAQAILSRRGNYRAGEQWDDKVKSVLILTFDVQFGFWVYVLRQWQPGGASRLIESGTTLDSESLRLLQIKLLVKDRSVWGDCAYENMTVFRACQSYGWIAMIGSDDKEFARKVWNERTRKWELIKTFWRATQLDPATGQRLQGRGQIPRFSWCNDHYLDLLYLFLIPGESAITSHPAPLWEIPTDASHDYIAQMSAVERIKEVDADGVVSWRWRWTGRHDFCDCEQMQIVVADQAGLFISPEA